MILGPVALSRRMADIAPFYVMALLARARELEAAGRSIIHLEIGEPDFPTAAPILAAGQRALAEGRKPGTPPPYIWKPMSHRCSPLSYKREEGFHRSTNAGESSPPVSDLLQSHSNRSATPNAPESRRAD